MASVELQKQNQLLDAHRTDIQNELNEFNKENVRYQANVQAELAKHNTDLQVELRQAQLQLYSSQSKYLSSIQNLIERKINLETLINSTNDNLKK